METPTIAVGDVVKLKSGGPWMTVEKVKDGSVSCLWFMPDVVEGYSFSLECLTKRDQPMAPPRPAPAVDLWVTMANDGRTVSFSMPDGSVVQHTMNDAELAVFNGKPATSLAPSDTSGLPG